jgi:hypothetical protein
MSAAGYLDEYQVRIRNRADNADLLVLSSVPAGTNPYIKEPPKGDGTSFNPMTSEMMAGSYTVLVVDAITSGTDRVVTSKLEDVNALLQLGYLKTYIERRKDGGAWTSRAVGYLVLLRLTDAVTWELTVQDALRALDQVPLFSVTSTTTIAAFFAAWPTRGTVLGGPILNGFANGFPSAFDLGGWRMKVRTIPPPSPNPANVPTHYALAPVNVYGPPDFSPTHGHIGDYADAINAGVATLPTQNEQRNAAGTFLTVADAMALTAWRGLMLLIDGVPFAPALGDYFPATGAVRLIDDANPFKFVSTFYTGGLYARLDGQAALTDGATVAVRALTILPTPISPIYVDRHPVDLLSDLCALAGVGFADTNGVKALFGDGLRVALPLTGEMAMGDLLKAAVFNFGIGVVTDGSGNVVPFAMRRFSNALPTKVITDALVVDGSVKLPFEQDVSLAGLQTFTFRHKALAQVGGVITRLDVALGRVVQSNALDGITEHDQVFTELNGDASAMLSGSLDITIPGMVHLSGSSLPIDKAWVYAEAQLLFDRFGRANQQAEFDLARGDGTTDADLATYGEEVLL